MRLDRFAVNPAPEPGTAVQFALSRFTESMM